MVPPQLTDPAEVSVALAEIAESAKEGLLALAVGAGLQALQTLMEQSITNWPAVGCVNAFMQLAGTRGASP